MVVASLRAGALCGRALCGRICGGVNGDSGGRGIPWRGRVTLLEWRIYGGIYAIEWRGGFLRGVYRAIL